MQLFYIIFSVNNIKQNMTNKSYIVDISNKYLTIIIWLIYY